MSNGMSTRKTIPEAIASWRWEYSCWPIWAKKIIWNCIEMGI